MKSNEPKNNAPNDADPSKPFADISSVRDKPVFYTQVAIAVISLVALIVIAYQMIIQSRAWITVKSTEIIKIKEGQPVTAKIIFHNSGKSPALNVILHNRINIYIYPAPDPLSHGDSTNPVGHYVIGPDSDMNIIVTSEEAAASKDLQAIHNNKAAIYIHGQVDYRDIFNSERRTEYCMVSRADYLSLIACEKQNTAN